MKRHAFAALQVVLAGGILYTLFASLDDRGAVWDTLARLRRTWPWMAASLLLCLVGFVACTRRWMLILAAQGLIVSWSMALKLMFIGHFFNAFLFGSNGGDLVRAVMVAKRSPGKRSEAFASVIIDRFIGVLTLLMFGLTVVFGRWNLFFGQEAGGRGIAVGLLVISAVAALAFVFMFRWNPLRHSRRLARFRAETRFGGIIDRMYVTSRFCLTHRRLFARTAALSLFNHLVLAYCAMLAAFAIGVRTTQPSAGSGATARTPAAEQPCDPRGNAGRAFVPETAAIAFQEAINYATVFPLCNAVASIPLTPGGLGTREYTAQKLLGLSAFRVPPADALLVSLLLHMVMLFWSVVGGLVFIADRLLAARGRG